MGADSLYLKDPAGSRFVGGGLAEVESLLGSPLPQLPPPEIDDGRPVYFVRFHPKLRTLLHRYLLSLLTQIGLEVPAGSRADTSARDQQEYEAALGKILRSVRGTDRRLGLTNLFWLAHTRDVAASLREMEPKSPAIKKLKYSLHPLLATFYRHLDQAAKRDVLRASPQAAFVAGPKDNPALVEALIEDGFAFTELSISDLDFNQFLAVNKRFRLSAELFFEIYQILLRETERRLREGERSLVSRVAKHLPGLPKDQTQTQAGALKVMMNTQIMTYLLADAWNTGAKLLASAKIKAETEKRRPAEIVDAFLDLVACVKRFEVLSNVRDRVALVEPFAGERDLDERISRGLRLYEFRESAQVLNNAVNATVLFRDLRGFTKTSEGHISERDLTQELYTVFDAFVPHVRRFGGTVDKFLGAGIMITFGTFHGDPLNPLNAVRTAVLCQDTLLRLRQEVKTYFKMGVAIHYGRVYIARFIEDE